MEELQVILTNQYRCQICPHVVENKYYLSKHIRIMHSPKTNILQQRLLFHGVPHPLGDDTAQTELSVQMSQLQESYNS